MLQLLQSTGKPEEILIDNNCIFKFVYSSFYIFKTNFQYFRYSPMGAITAVSQPTATLPADYLTTSALLQMSQLNALAGLNPFATATAVPDFTASLIAHQQQQHAVAQQHAAQTASPPATNGQVAGLAAHAQLSALSASVAATLPPSDTAGYCLFVYNLSSDTDDTLLWQLFSQFGAIVNVKVSKKF